MAARHDADGIDVYFVNSTKEGINLTVYIQLPSLNVSPLDDLVECPRNGEAIQKSYPHW